MNILVIKQTSLGDVLHSTAAIEIIKYRFPDSHLTYLVDESCKAVIAHNPFVDEIITLDLNKLQRIFSNGAKKPLTTIKEIRQIWKTILKQLCARKYDYAIDLQGLFRSAIFLYFVNAKIKITKSFFPFLKYYKNKQIHAIDEMKTLLSKIGFIDSPKTPTQMTYFFEDKVNKKIKDFYSKAKKSKLPVLVISPFSRWENKNWSIKNYLRLLECLVKYKINIVISGTSEKAKIISDLILNLKNDQANIFNFAGKLSLDDFAQLVNGCDLHLSSDSFPMHLASALGKKQIALFAPTREEKVGPRNKQAVVLRDKDCGRCYQRNCQRGCIDKISVQEVHREIVKQLKIVSSRIHSDTYSYQ